LMHPAGRRLVPVAPSDPLGPVGDAALAAAEASYSPYSETYAGIALGLDDGSMQAARYAENAAFNPSLPPLQAALALLAVRSIPFSRIRQAVLVETGGPASQRTATEALLAAVAPSVSLTYVLATEPEAGTAATVQASDGLDSTDNSGLS
jgi:hypothetical protein